MWEYRATLPLYGSTTALRDVVHDGDTSRFLIDAGFDTRVEKWIRYADVRAPETNEPGITETRLFVMDWLGRRATSKRWPFRIVTDVTATAEPTERTSFARYIGTIYDLSTGECLNAAMRDYLAQHPEWPAGRALRGR